MGVISAGTSWTAGSQMPVSASLSRLRCGRACHESGVVLGGRGIDRVFVSRRRGAGPRGRTHRRHPAVERTGRGDRRSAASADAGDGPHRDVRRGQRHRAALSAVSAAGRAARRDVERRRGGGRRPRGTRLGCFPISGSRLRRRWHVRSPPSPTDRSKTTACDLATPRPRRSTTPASTTASCCPTRLFRHDRRPGRTS